MNKKRLINALFAIVAASALVFSCIDFLSIIWPTEPKANSDFEVEVNIHLEPQTERDGRFVLAILVPKSWKVPQQEIEASYSAENLQVKGELVTITNEKMTLCNDYPEPTTSMAYNNAMLSQYGVLGNTGPVEWVVLRGSTVINVNGGGTHPYTTAKATIKFKTGPTNVKFFTAIATCLDDNGFNTNQDGEFVISETQTIEVTGGTGHDDFTVLHFVATTPQTFRFGDYVSIEFVSAIDDTKTDLYGEEVVYLNAKCLVEGRSGFVTGKPVLMQKDGEVFYNKYIYPKAYFGLAESAKITNMYVWFTNKDGSKTATEGENGFEVFQASE